MSTVLWHLSGKGIDSANPLASWEAGPDSALKMLRALEVVLDRRTEFTRQAGLVRFPTSDTEPEILLVIDHAERILPLAPEGFARVVRYGGKMGIRAEAHTEVANIAAFGYSDALRDAILGSDRGAQDHPEPHC